LSRGQNKKYLYNMSEHIVKSHNKSLLLYTENGVNFNILMG